MLFQAVVIFLPILNFFKISCKRGKVHSVKVVIDSSQMCNMSAKRNDFLHANVKLDYIFVIQQGY